MKSLGLFWFVAVLGAAGGVAINVAAAIFIPRAYAAWPVLVDGPGVGNAVAFGALLGLCSGMVAGLAVTWAARHGEGASASLASLVLPVVLVGALSELAAFAAAAIGAAVMGRPAAASITANLAWAVFLTAGGWRVAASERRRRRGEGMAG